MAEAFQVLAIANSHSQHTSPSTRAAFTARLGRGTLMIFKDLDDQFFCHEAEFSETVRLSDPTGYRLCYVFRWCTSVKNFRCAPAHNFKSHVRAPDNVVCV